MVRENRDPLGIGKICIKPEKGTKDIPEMVPAVAIIFGMPEGQLAGEAAKNEGAGMRPGHGMEPAGRIHGFLRDTGHTGSRSGLPVGVFEEQVAVALAVIGDLVFMKDTGTFDRAVFLFVAATEPAGAVRAAELLFVPHQSLYDRTKLLLVRVQDKTLFFGIAFHPLEHLFFVCHCFTHADRSCCFPDTIFTYKTLVFVLVLLFGQCLFLPRVIRAATLV
jgi:hypothetical protein